jgi:hypothetical protein
MGPTSGRARSRSSPAGAAEAGRAARGGPEARRRSALHPPRGRPRRRASCALIPREVVDGRPRRAALAVWKRFVDAVVLGDAGLLPHGDAKRPESKGDTRRAPLVLVDDGGSGAESAARPASVRERREDRPARPIPARQPAPRGGGARPRRESGAAGPADREEDGDHEREGRWPRPRPRRRRSAGSPAGGDQAARSPWCRRRGQGGAMPPARSWSGDMALVQQVDRMVDRVEERRPKAR